MCDLMARKNNDYKVSNAEVIMLIEPIRDSTFAKMTGRSQRKIYGLCSRHMRVLTIAMEDYVNGLYIPSTKKGKES